VGAAVPRDALFSDAGLRLNCVDPFLRAEPRYPPLCPL
jgi:hypothetical protein